MIKGPELVVIRSVDLQETVQVCLAEEDDMIEAFAANRSDEPLNVTVLPR
jgi:hypothetical protein